ncbi:MAG: hypothetical protein RLZ98_1670 [Pseudomonadota bacterium]|jgi:tripartite-type tricarboxylate transporter receptor subunit TctC
MSHRLRCLLASSVIAVPLTSGAAEAQSLADFYKGKQVSVIVSSDSGSTYDSYARFLARHIGKHIPGNPKLIVQNMPGAGQLKGTEYIYKIAPKDGTVIGTISRGFPFDPILGVNPLNIDPMKFVWLGSMNREVSLAISWHTTSVKTLEDARKTEILIAGTGAAADSEIMPKAFNSLAGTKFKIISGYRGLTGGSLAMERGEVQGIGYYSWSSVKRKDDWLNGKKINLLFHTGKTAHPELPGVPLIREAVKDEVSRKALSFLLDREILGRPFVAPPGIPQDRAKALRAAFNATMKDPEFVAEAHKRKVEAELVTAEEVEALLREANAAPKDVIDRAKEVLGRK